MHKVNHNKESCEENSIEFHLKIKKKNNFFNLKKCQNVPFRVKVTKVNNYKFQLVVR